jgi:hypothetical protein
MGTVCGLSVKETLLANPGMIYDLFELYIKTHGMKKKEGEADYAD